MLRPYRKSAVDRRQSGNAAVDCSGVLPCASRGHLISALCTGDCSAASHERARSSGADGCGVGRHLTTHGTRRRARTGAIVRCPSTRRRRVRPTRAATGPVKLGSNLLRQCLIDAKSKRRRVTQTGTPQAVFFRTACRVFAFCQDWCTRSVHALQNQLSGSGHSRGGKVCARATSGKASVRHSLGLVQEGAAAGTMCSLRQQGQFGQ